MSSLVASSGELTKCLANMAVQKASGRAKKASPSVQQRQMGTCTILFTTVKWPANCQVRRSRVKLPKGDSTTGRHNLCCSFLIIGVNPGGLRGSRPLFPLILLVCQRFCATFYQVHLHLERCW